MEAASNKHKRTIPEKYTHITYEVNFYLFQQRIRLIELVQEERVTIPESCRKLKIKKSTAKYILRDYRRHGKIFCRKSEQTIDKKSVT